jgi:hypothetical protein
MGENGGNGGVVYAVQTAVNGGSELLIFVPRRRAASRPIAILKVS